jgi:multidrug efflux system outer membrane protein
VRAGHGFSSAIDAQVEDGLTWSFGPSIALPLFDYGRRRANLTIAQERENIAIAEYERTIRSSFREVADALAGRHYLAGHVTFFHEK